MTHKRQAGHLPVALTSKRFVRRWGSCSEEPSESSVFRSQSLETYQSEKHSNTKVQTVLPCWQSFFCIIMCWRTNLNITVTRALALIKHAPCLQNCEHINTAGWSTTFMWQYLIPFSSYRSKCQKDSTVAQILIDVNAAFQQKCHEVWANEKTVLLNHTAKCKGIFATSTGKAPFTGINLLPCVGCLIPINSAIFFFSLEHEEEE